MHIFVLLYNSGTDKEGIHSIELKGRTIVLMFEDKDDAIRYCGLLEAQDFPLPTVEMINIDEIRDFCIKVDYECKLVEKNFVPKTPEDRLLISPPQKNLELVKSTSLFRPSCLSVHPVSVRSSQNHFGITT